MERRDSLKMQRLEHQLQEIEAVDDFRASTFRAVYDGDTHRQFLERLDTRIKAHDRDIERTCNAHYQGFIESIRELVQVRTPAGQLNEEVVSVDEELQKASSELAARKEELACSQRAERRVAGVLEQLQACLQPLQALGRLQTQLSQGRHYQALRSLEQLEHSLLPPVRHLHFAQQMSARVPQMRASIKEASMMELKDFLEGLRKNSSTIGALAMDQTAEQLSPSSQLPNGIPADKNTDSGVSASAQDHVDFSPVYRYVHIYTVLGEREALEDYYRQQRRKQLRLILQPAINMHESIEGYRSYFQEIVGFFVVEDHLLNTTGGLVDRAYLDDLWELALARVVTVLGTHSAYCTDANLMLRIKRIIVLFSSTLRSYGFGVSKLMKLLYEIHDHYSEVLMLQWVHIFREIFSEDNYSPMQVGNEEEFRSVLESFPFREESLEKASFPRRLPFSSMVPRVYMQVKEFVYACMKFSEGLGFTRAQTDQLLRKSASLLLVRTLSGCLLTLVRQPGLGLLQLIQIIHNTTHLERASVFLDQFVSNLTGVAGKEAGKASGLQAGSTFADIRTEAEKEIYAKMEAKVDDLVGLAASDWLQPEAEPTEPSAYVLDLVAFLQSTFRAFTNLPPKVAQTACKTACLHLNHSLLRVLEEEERRQVSMGALQQLQLDLQECEKFAASEPVPGLPAEELLGCFEEVRQLLALFLRWDWPNYLCEQRKTEKPQYGRVPPRRALLMLEKLREADKKKVFAVLKKSERDKKKLQETIVKQLRKLIAEESDT